MAPLKLGVNLRTIPVTSDYTVGVYDDVINVNAALGACAITLPDATLCPGKTFIINKIDSSSYLVRVAGPQTINGQSALFLTAQDESIQLASVGGVYLSVGVGTRSVETYSKSFQNNLINADLHVSQRYPTNAGLTLISGTSNYYVDRVAHYLQGATSKTLDVIQSTDVPTLEEAGYLAQYSLQFTNTSGFATSDSADLVSPFMFNIEGYDYKKLHGGLVTIGFWFKSTIAGSYPISFHSQSNLRSYVSTITVDQANTWEFITKTIQLETDPTNYDFENGLGLQIVVGSAANATFVTATTDEWINGIFAAESSSANRWNATAGAVMRLALPQLVKGSYVDPKAFQSRGASFAEEFAMMNRYCWSPTYLHTVTGGIGPLLSCAVASTTPICMGTFPVPMRDQPTPIFGTMTDLNVTPAAGTTQSITAIGGDTRMTTAGYWITLACVNTGISDPIPGVITAANANAHIVFHADI